MTEILSHKTTGWASGKYYQVRLIFSLLHKFLGDRFSSNRILRNITERVECKIEVTCQVARGKRANTPRHLLKKIDN